VTVVAIRRHNTVVPNPSAEEKLATGDVCLVRGAPDRIPDAAAVFGD